MPRPSTPKTRCAASSRARTRASPACVASCGACPTHPICKLCAAPFEGPGGAVLRHVGFARYPGNPAICGSCIKDLNKLGVVGAEIPVSLLFADIRDSTGIGERSSPTEFRAFLDHFYRLSSSAILDNDGIVDKFVGDEAIGLFFIGISGSEHRPQPSGPRARCSMLSGAPMRARAGLSPSVRPCTLAMRSSARPGGRSGE